MLLLRGSDSSKGAIHMQMNTRGGKRPRRILRKRIWSRRAAALCFSLMLAALAGYSGRAPAEAARPPTARVEHVTDDDFLMLPVPVRAVARGERVVDIPFTTASWPRSKVQESYLRNIALHKESIFGSSLPAQMPVPLGMLHPSGIDLNAVVEKIPAGMRAITVRVDEESAVEGWARSGSHVDVIVVRAGGKGSLESKVIAENVRILSAGRSADPMSGGSSAPKAPSTITLLVSQEDALRIKTAANIGKLTFSLRGVNDEAPADVRFVRQDQLLSTGADDKTFDYQGLAKGPGGEIYYLVNDRRWIKHGEGDFKPPKGEK